MLTKSKADMPPKRRIFIVDYHPIVREGLSLMMNREPDLMVCGEAEEAATALQAIAASRPDFLIVDISLNGPDGLDLLKSIRVRFPNLPVLMLSMHDESIYAERALRAGANGYIIKQEATEKVLVALRQSGAVSEKAAAFRRGVCFLLTSQLDDVSWFVASRSLPIQPHFETGFPHGRSQFISCAATSWATLALILSTTPA